MFSSFIQQTASL